jgi:SAM-dependent methyltransferase
MVSIDQQIETGRLVCPSSHQRLVREGDRLRTADGRFVYPVVNGVPVLLERDRQTAYLNQLDGAMSEVYARAGRLPALAKAFETVVTWGGDYRSEHAERAFHETIVDQPSAALCVSVGGGPMRIHHNLVNLNIDLFPNVDVVGDAYALPYACDAVDAIYCEAVLEHLEFPNDAVKEMHRVLRPGGQLFAATPFLQMFHGYPNHYQNFTLVGHERLFVRAGFGIRSSGVCVGPTFALLEGLTNYSRYLPTRLLSKWVYRAWRLLSVAIRPLDRWVNRRPDAPILASSTYVHAVKGPLEASGSPRQSSGS